MDSEGLELTRGFHNPERKAIRSRAGLVAAATSQANLSKGFSSGYCPVPTLDFLPSNLPLSYPLQGVLTTFVQL